MDDELEHSPRSWLDDFTQRFSWCHPSARASPFLNNYFLPGVTYLKTYLSNQEENPMKMEVGVEVILNCQQVELQMAILEMNKMESILKYFLGSPKLFHMELRLQQFLHLKNETKIENSELT